MVLMLPPRQQQPTTAQRFIDAFGSGLDAVSNHMKEKQKKEKMQAAATKLQIDPAILDLPEDAQKAYFQQKFAAGPKPLNALQEAQRDAAIAKQKYYEENQKLFGGIFGGNQQQGPQNFQNQVMQEPQVDQGTFGKGIMKPGETLPEKPQPKGKANAQAKFDIADPKTWPDTMISKLRAFKGQPGQQGTFGNLANDEADRRINEVKNEEKKSERLEDIDIKRKELFHKETEKFDQTLADQAVAAAKKNRAIDRQLVNVDKITNFDRFISSVFGQSKFGDLLRSTTAQEFDANTLAQLEGQRQILGGVLSDADIRLLMQKIVTASKTPEANKVIAQSMKFENDLIMGKRKIADEIRKENKGYRPADYEAEIEKRYNEKYGDEIQGHLNKIMSLADDPKKLKDITGREKVMPGTPISVSKSKEYIKIANGDRSLAEQMAREDGYQF